MAQYGIQMFPTKLSIISQPPAQSTTPFSNSYSLVFDACDDYVSIGDVSDLDFGSGNFSVSFWGKTGTDAIQTILGKQDTGSGWYLYYDTDDRILYYDRKNGDYTIGSADSFDPDGVWRHVVFVKEGAVGKIYVNGSDATASTDDISLDVDSAGDNFEIGRRNLGGSVTREFNGSLDEIAIFDAALSSSAVSTIYNSGTPKDESSTSNLVGYWRFEEGSGSSVADSSSNSNAGTIYNAVHSSSVPPS
jgi:hypothetical protein